jgi:hypothetical protein
MTKRLLMIDDFPVYIERGKRGLYYLTSAVPEARGLLCAGRTIREAIGKLEASLAGIRYAKGKAKE